MGDLHRENRHLHRTTGQIPAKIEQIVKAEPLPVNGVWVSKADIYRAILRVLPEAREVTSQTAGPR